MAIEWLIKPLLEGSLEHRKEMKDLLDKGISLAIGRKTKLAFTGLPGAGKTVLYHYLSGKADREDYKKPMQSNRLEQGKIKAKADDGKKRLLVSVIPGQRSTTRFEALDRVFIDKPTDGVIHVVSNGYASVRTLDAKDYMLKDVKATTIDQYRKYNLDHEIQDLQATCDVICASQRKRRSPTWLIVVVAKLDLFNSENHIREARAYYSPHSDSAFSQVLQNFVRRVGNEFMRIESAPVACCLENFEWNNSVVRTDMSEAIRDEYLAQLLEFVVNYSK